MNDKIRKAYDYGWEGGFLTIHNVKAMQEVLGELFGRPVPLRLCYRFLKSMDEGTDLSTIERL